MIVNITQSERLEFALYERNTESERAEDEEEEDDDDDDFGFIYLSI
jgi:hypothetical protein